MGWASAGRDEHEEHAGGEKDRPAETLQTPVVDAERGDQTRRSQQRQTSCFFKKK